MGRPLLSRGYFFLFSPQGLAQASPLSGGPGWPPSLGQYSQDWVSPDHTEMYVSIYTTHGKPQTSAGDEPGPSWRLSTQRILSHCRWTQLTLQSASSIHLKLRRLALPPLWAAKIGGWCGWPGAPGKKQFTYSETLKTGRSILAFWTHQTL